MFGIGSTEFLVIIVVAVLVLGPEHLPKVMRTISKVMSEFRKVSTDFQRAVNLETALEEQKQAKAVKKKKKKAVASPSESSAMAQAPVASPQPEKENTTPAAPTASPEGIPSAAAMEELANLNKQQQEDAAKPWEEAETESTAETTKKAAVAPSSQGPAA